MNKLTAEKCREQIDNLNAEWEGNGITDEESLYLQALEIALPILEQQERGEGEGEWMEWGGGECPVDEDAIVEMKWKYGDQITNRAGIYQWSYYEYGDRIIAYRIIPERATNQNGDGA